ETQATSEAAEGAKGAAKAHDAADQHGSWILAPLEDGEDGQLLEEVARHLVQLGFRRRRDDHAEVVGLALEARLHREALGLLLRVPGDERLLRGLLHVFLPGGEIAAGGAGGRRVQLHRGHRGQKRRDERPQEVRSAHGTVLSDGRGRAARGEGWYTSGTRPERELARRRGAGHFPLRARGFPLV